MSAKALAALNFEPVAEQTVAADRQALEGLAAEIQFREDLWREYRREAISAGISPARATEYASALSPEMGRVEGISEMVPAGRRWFYQSRIRVTRRTITSGLLTLMRWEKSNTAGRTAAAGTSIFGPGFRPWTAGGKS